MQDIISLRPHHALCIQFFEGKGYSPEFVKNMATVIEHLKQDTKIMLTVGTDRICDSCPNRKEEQCNQDAKVIRYDKAVLSVCQLNEEQEYHWQEIDSKVNTLIIQPDMLHNICGDCSWFTICRRKCSSN